jgi:Tfp pilus assembly protein PilX
MRGMFIVGLLIVALIVGLLVMKNMEADNSRGVTKTQAQKYINKAESATDDANKRLNDLSKQVKDANAD